MTIESQIVEIMMSASVFAVLLTTLYIFFR